MFFGFARCLIFFSLLVFPVSFAQSASHTTDSGSHRYAGQANASSSCLCQESRRRYVRDGKYQGMPSLHLSDYFKPHRTSVTWISKISLFFPFSLSTTICLPRRSTRSRKSWKKNDRNGKNNSRVWAETLYRLLQSDL